MKNRITILASSLSISLIAGCSDLPDSNSHKSSQTDFISSAIGTTSPTPINLSRIPRGITAFALSTPIDGIADPLLRNHLSFKLGRLTLSQFTQIKETYSGWSGAAKSKAIFLPEREYELIDFLPVAMQALVGKRFEERTIDVPADVSPPRSIRDPFSINLSSNCWTTAYEIQRHASDAFVAFYVAPNQIRKVLEDNSVSDVVKSLNQTELALENSQLRNQSIKPGDTLYIYGPGALLQTDASAIAASKEELLHVAIFLDDDVYFEKSAKESQSAYRIASFSDIRKKYSDKSTGSTEQYRYVFRRFGKAELKHPAEEFSMAVSPPYDKVMASDDFKRNTIMALEQGNFSTFTESFSAIKSFPIAIDPTTGLAKFDSLD
jgi:hypothetical protein